jgi:hypothetical protein
MASAPILSAFLMTIPICTIGYYVTFKYASGDDDFTHEQRVGWRHHRKWCKGDHVTICYLPWHPEISRLWDEDRDDTYYNAARVGLVIAFFLVLPMLWQFPR